MVKFALNKDNNEVELILNEEILKEFENNEKFLILKANSTDAAGEKHVPVIEQNGQNVLVKVGSVEHPMLENHYIKFIVLETKNHVIRVDLTPNDKPVANFILEDGDEVVNAYELCNLHGLWSNK